MVILTRESGVHHCSRRLLAALFVVSALFCRAQATGPAPDIKTAQLGNGIRLHYAEQGSGTPLIFVHGSLSDGGYWSDELAPFSKYYHVIAYSRRYNSPNDNPVRPGYSAVTDAEDLAGLIRVLHLGRVVVIGHSYGALTALFLEMKHPEMLRAVVLAEPPAVSLLKHLPPAEAKSGEDAFRDIQQRMVQPMQQAFRKGHTEEGVAVFIDYVFNDPHAWEKMSASARKQTLQDAHEWDVMMTSGTLFPDVDLDRLRQVKVPTLLLWGQKTYPFLVLIMQELDRLLPNHESAVLPDAGHQMWYQDPEVCRQDVEKFLAKSGVQ